MRQAGLLEVAFSAATQLHHAPRILETSIIDLYELRIE